MVKLLGWFLAVALTAGGLTLMGGHAHAVQWGHSSDQFIEVWALHQLSRAQFIVTENGATDKPIIASSREAFSLTDEDERLIMSDWPGTVVETAERRRILDRFVAELRAQGWQPADKGEAWYSYRFRRSAR